MCFYYRLCLSQQVCSSGIDLVMSAFSCIVGPVAGLALRKEPVHVWVVVTSIHIGTYDSS